LVARRSWMAVARRPVVLTFSFVQPLVWMAFFGFLFERFPVADDASFAYLDFLAPGVCAMTVLFGASQSGIAWIRDLQTGFLPRLLRTPASRHSILLGKILADVIRLSLQALVVLGLAWILGARFAPTLGSTLGSTLLSAVIPGFIALVLFAGAFSCLSCAIALKTRAQEAMATFVHVVNMPLLFTSTALVPVRQMPDWLAGLARFNPLSLAVNAWRQALLFGQAPPWASLGLLLLLAALLYAAAFWAMQGVTELD